MIYNVLNGLGKFSPNFSLNFTHDGLSGSKLTDDKVAMASVFIPNTAFREYEVDKPVSVTFDLGALRKSFSKVKTGSASLSLTEANGLVKLVVRDEKRGIRSSLNLRVTEGEIQKSPEPKVSSSVEFACGYKVMETAISESTVISEELEFKAFADSIELISSEGGRTYTAILRRDKPLKELTIEAEASSSYSSEVLNMGLQALGGLGDLRISFGNQVPIRLSAEIEGGGYLNVWVAPRL
ncbi:DNA polymerase III sliding clamp [Sulfodiicoccus acidiphilus]|uniref:DNA polymerase III sliding clamp n=1 Tax=Sulfodiicoccus acidiphilus TaxID=1670455 RepID=A0A348B173_9CREN|nr:hypothetical protein [Sulfodiicoccus acidiphilus]BBD71925.1 DNA polymerase III sliding clamp [Sulfodiicoccus acidiphilus]